MAFTGSIKWLSGPFDGRDLSALVAGAAQVRGFDPASAGLAVVSLSGIAPDVDRARVQLVWGPHDVLAAWQHG